MIQGLTHTESIEFKSIDFNSRNINFVYDNLNLTSRGALIIRLAIGNIFYRQGFVYQYHIGICTI